jgi:hypothetical protein
LGRDEEITIYSFNEVDFELGVRHVTRCKLADNVRLPNVWQRLHRLDFEDRDMIFRIEDTRPIAMKVSGDLQAVRRSSWFAGVTSDHLPGISTTSGQI